MDIGQQVMAFITNPNVAYLALIVGLVMLVVAVTTPGTGLAEVIAVIALAVALIGLVQLRLTSRAWCSSLRRSSSSHWM